MHIYNTYKSELNNSQLNQFLALIDPQNAPETLSKKRPIMVNRAKQFIKQCVSLNKSGRYDDIKKFKAEPPVGAKNRAKRSRGNADTHAPKRTTNLASAPNSPTRERPSQKHCHQKSPGRKQADDLPLTLRKMKVDVANLNSQLKSHQKKGTALEQEAEANVNMKLTALFHTTRGTQNRNAIVSLSNNTHHTPTQLHPAISQLHFSFVLSTFTLTAKYHTHTNMHKRRTRTGRTCGGT